MKEKGVGGREYNELQTKIIRVEAIKFQIELRTAITLQSSDL